MRITIEPSIIETNYRNAPKVVVDTDGDDIAIDELSSILKGALLAYGYGETSVEEIFAKDNHENN